MVKETVTRYTYYPPDIVKVTSYKRRRTLTLKQFAIRRHFADLAKNTSGIKGTKIVNGRPMPSNAFRMKQSLGTKADDIITPEVIAEYNATYKKRRWKKKQ